MRSLAVVMLLLSCRSNAQEKGIEFQQHLSWMQIKEKAKTGNKYILVDCYATWCGPCKNMDQYVYPDEKLGQFINDEFISVKIQMDSTSSDNNRIKSWYYDAHEFIEKYNVNVYPSILFFNPDGKLVHKKIGYQSIDSLFNSAKNALVSAKQYYTLLNRYNEGKLSYDGIRELAIMAKSLDERKQAEELASNYETNYLFKLNREELRKRENLEFITDLTFSVNDPGFKFICRHVDQIDKIISKKIAEHKIISIIVSSEISPHISAIKAMKDWDKIAKQLRSRYGMIGYIAVLQEQLKYYFNAKKWVEFGKTYRLYYEKVGTLNIFHVNNMSWEVFDYVNDKSILRFAIKVMDDHKVDDVSAMDTYANLLYKIGERANAIKWEQRAIEGEQETASKNNRVMNNVFIGTKEKMENNIPTWSTLNE